MANPATNISHPVIEVTTKMRLIYGEEKHCTTDIVHILSLCKSSNTQVFEMGVTYYISSCVSKERLAVE